METVLELLKELGGRASVNQISELGKRRKVDDSGIDKTKIRDSLVRLRKKGLVLGNPASKDYTNEVWTLVKIP